MALDITQLMTATSPSQSQSSSGSPSTAAPSKGSFWHELITHVASWAGVNPDLALGVAMQESGMDPHALNPSSGAKGLMQLMPGTAAAMGVNPDEPLGNVLGGVRYLREQLSTFGDNAKALAAYNWGPRHVAEAVERWGSDWLSHAPSETQHYVASILSRIGGNAASSVTAGAAPSNASYKASAISSATPVSAVVAAKVASVRSALAAYLLSEVLD